MANSHDIKANEKTYGAFIGLLKWAIPLIALLTLIVLVIISN
ncbi:MAG: aa3-type cytochrome c oxidase subunit IV [Alteraurantiacibacter sp.]|nr:aa3-type cytochrome c oxidase subunit IV [Alteraurantiacibacter sp.]